MTIWFRALTVFVLFFIPQFLHAGWNYGSRSKCGVFKKYRVEAHAGIKTVPYGTSLSVQRDTGCTYAHAGPVRKYHGSSLLSQAEGYIGNSAFWGYAQSWNYVNLPIIKIGFAGDSVQTESEARVATPAASSECGLAPSGRNQFFATGVMFTDGGRSGKRITIKEVVASFAATQGYSVFEIVVWKPADDLEKRVPDTNLTRQKTIWRGKAIIHEGRLSLEGDLPARLFTASTPTARNPEILYTIDNKDIVISLPSSVNLDQVELHVRGDAGDESVVNPQPAPKPETIANLNMQGGTESTPCPPEGVELSRDDAPAVPYLAAMLPALDQRCVSRGAGLKLDTITFSKCAKDPRGAGFGPNATATFTCTK